MRRTRPSCGDLPGPATDQPEEDILEGRAHALEGQQAHVPRHDERQEAGRRGPLVRHGHDDPAILLANAVDAVKERADGRELRIEATADGSGFVRIAVADNGAGVAPDVAASLFDPFVTTKAKGMGLGLAISRSIVDAHGGRLWHEPGMPGSAFCFTLPVYDESVT